MFGESKTTFFPTYIDYDRKGERENKYENMFLLSNKNDALLLF